MTTKLMIYSNLNFKKIFEQIFFNLNPEFKKLIDLLDNNNYFYFQIKENIICFPKEKKPIIKLFNQ